MRHLSHLVLAGALALCPACDPIHGINRVAPLPLLPELACVEAAIRSIPEVREVRQSSEEGGRPLTWTGIQAPSRLHYFTYALGSTGATLLLSVDYEGEVEMSQHLLRIGERVPREEIAQVRSVMLRIEAALEERCGVRLPAIKEY